MELSAAKQREKGIYRVTLTGSVVNLSLVAVKLSAGIAGRSAAMVADAMHSLSDLVTDIVVILFVRVSSRPRDDSHAYGYGKFETMATLIIGLVLLCVGVGIAWNGIGDIAFALRGGALESPGIVAFGAAILSMAAKEGLFRYTASHGRRLRSDALTANALHHRSDALSSVGTTLGIGGAIILGPRWAILDPLAAVAVSAFILHSAVELVRPCLDELLERSLDDPTQQQILEIVNTHTGGDCTIRTRKIGSYYAIEVRMCMSGDTPLEEAHRHTSLIERKLREEYGDGTQVTVHLAPN